jgi:hypothetical protein
MMTILVLQVSSEKETHIRELSIKYYPELGVLVPSLAKNWGGN